MSIAENAVREHASNLVARVEALLATAHEMNSTAMASGLELTLDAIRDEFSDYLPAEVAR